MLPALLAPLGGVIDLLKGDRGGIAKLASGTNAGLIASFVIPAILLLPGYAYLAAERFDALKIEPSLAQLLTIEPVGYLIGWTLFPVLAHLYCARIGKPHDWYDYIAAYNWSNILQMGLYLPASLIADLGLAPPLLFVLSVMVLAAAIGIHYRIAIVVLRVDPLPALVLVAIDLASSILLARIVERLYA